MNKPLFGTSGVRGVVNEDLTPDLCKKVGQALATFLPPQSSVCIGTDPRLSRELVKQAVCDGLTESGANVAVMGIVPTPVLALVTREMGFDAGIMITASHNPPEFNGIKLFNGDSIGFSRNQEEEIESIVSSGAFRAGQRGVLETVPGMAEKYWDYVKPKVESWGFNRDLRILVDPGNGAASGFASTFLRRLDFNPIPFNDVPDGRFPGRSPEPKEDTLEATVKFLRQKNADLAVCFDGDADRVVFCDQKGFIGFNEMAAFMARDAIRRSGKKIIATTVETGMLVDLAVRDVGGRVVRGQVGDVYAAHLARESDAALGVETVGVYIMPEVGYYPDSFFATLTLLNAVSDVSEIRRFIESLPRVYFSKEKVACRGQIKEPAMAAVGRALPSMKAAVINDLDGLRLEYEDAWVLIRASGTEPAIRVLAESRSKSYTDRLLKASMEIVAGAVKEAAA